MTQRKPQGSWLASGAILLGMMAGCHEHESFVHHKPPVDLPAPTGVHVREFEAVQVTKAKATNFVFFLNEWYMGGNNLGPMGLRHLQFIIDELHSTPRLVYIQPTLDPEVDDKRRLTIINALARSGMTDAAERVFIGFPHAEPLNGETAERAYLQMLVASPFYLGYGYGNGAFGGFGGYGGFGGLGGYGGFGGGYGGFGGGYGGFGGIGGIGGTGYGFGMFARPYGY